MAIYASVSDVELEWNRTIPDDALGHVARLIDRAERLVAAHIPNLGVRIADEIITREHVADVVASMVVRVLRNPDGKQAETAGDYSYQLAGAASAGRLYLSRDEINLLGGRRRFQSIQLSDDALESPLKLPPFAVEPREWTVYASGESP